MAGVGIDRADDPVGGHPAGDPEGALGPILEVLAEQRREQRGGLGERGRSGSPSSAASTASPSRAMASTRASRAAASSQSAAGLPPVAVVVVAAEHRPQVGLPLARGAEHAPDRATHQGHRVHGGDRVVQRGRVEHPPDAQEPGPLRGLEGPLEDPPRTVRAGEPRAHVDEHGVGEARMVEGSPPQAYFQRASNLNRSTASRSDRPSRRWRTITTATTRGGTERRPTSAANRSANSSSGNSAVALPGEQGMDRVRPDQRARRRSSCRGTGQPGGVRIPATSASSCDLRAGSSCLENRSCARALPSADQNARFTPAS